MRPQRLRKKLEFKKEVVATLNGNEMKESKGGTCTTFMIETDDSEFGVCYSEQHGCSDGFLSNC